jgi:large subunit ribosomal protein L9
MAMMEVILLERVDSLGALGETVRVKPGYARNFLLPQKKALRATNENKAYFDAQRAELEKQNAVKRADAEKLAKKLEGVKATLIRNAAEGGQLYGSVTTRDISSAVNEQAKVTVDRTMVMLNSGIKTVGLFPVTLMLHPEVKTTVIVNIARTEEEAKIQAKTGKALIADDGRNAPAPVVEDSKASMMEDEAIANEKAEAEAEAEDDAKVEAKKAKKAKKAEAEDVAPAVADSDSE